tara:strand:+ start:2026 stop:2499 length:474 start_codon:yes stop_codon:yes gene_type:complete
MPRQSVVSTGEVTEGNAWFFAFRVVRPDGTVVSDADITNDSSTQLTVTIYSHDTQAAIADEPVMAATTKTGTVTRSDHIMIATANATMPTDGFWDGVDSTGYNFFYSQSYQSWMEGGKRYRVQFSLKLGATNAGVDKGEVAWGDLNWAAVVYVKPMV